MPHFGFQADWKGFFGELLHESFYVCVAPSGPLSRRFWAVATGISPARKAASGEQRANGDFSMLRRTAGAAVNHSLRIRDIARYLDA